MPSFSVFIKAVLLVFTLTLECLTSSSYSIPIVFGSCLLFILEHVLNCVSWFCFTFRGFQHEGRKAVSGHHKETYSIID